MFANRCGKRSQPLEKPKELMEDKKFRKWGGGGVACF